MNAGVEEATTGPVRLKSVALPAEHGGWSMLGEPLVLGMLVAPSWAGLGVGLLAVGAFLLRHPLKLALADARRHRRGPRTALAVRFVLCYGTVAGAGLALAATGRPGFWLPLLLAAPLGVVQLAYDSAHHGRRLLPEMLGALALGSVAAAEMRAAGSSLALALAAWAMLATRAVAAVLYVRTRLRRDRGLAADPAPALASHAGALVIAIVLAGAGQAPWLAILAFALLLARAGHGLSRFHRPGRPQTLGVQELVHGLAFVLILAVGFAFGL